MALDRPLFADFNQRQPFSEEVRTLGSRHYEDSGMILFFISRIGNWLHDCIAEFFSLGF
jgi:hypothetical protein